MKPVNIFARTPTPASTVAEPTKPTELAKPAEPKKVEITSNFVVAIPVAAKSRKTPDKTFIFYAYLFATSPKEAVQRVGEGLQQDGLDLQAVTGKIKVTTLDQWTVFVSRNFDWMKDMLPTAEQLTQQDRSKIYYSPKIIQS